MSNILQKLRRGVTLLGELIKYETAALCAGVPYRSWRHYLLCAASEMKVSTHVSGYTPDIERYYMLDKLHIVRGKKVFLQHGIMIDDMKWYHYPNVVMDLFVFCQLVILS